MSARASWTASSTRSGAAASAWRSATSWGSRRGTLATTAWGSVGVYARAAWADRSGAKKAAPVSAVARPTAPKPSTIALRRRVPCTPHLRARGTSGSYSATVDYDYLVVGSGFGGSVSAVRLAEKGYSVGVIEMGKRWRPEDFPKTTWNLRRSVWRPPLGLYGFYNMRPFKHVVILCGNAVGGGSITYANTLLSPPASVWTEGSWKGLAAWEEEMPAHYATARRMLGVTENQILGDADRVLKQMADSQGIGDTFYKTDVAVYF